MTRSERLARRLLRLRARHERKLARAFRRFFRGQAARVVRRYGVMAGRELKAEGDLLLPMGEDWRLMQAVESLLWGLLTSLTVETAPFAGGPPLAEARLRVLLFESAERVRAVNRQTRTAIQRTLADGRSRGFSDWQIANGVPKDGYRGLRAVVRETYRGRAEAIARTEVGIASQQVAHETWGQAGVTHVDIIDGDGCGWTSHTDPDTANGSRRTLAEAMAQPLSHPRCRRVSLPIVGG
ncbi:MAG: hypothetical protein AB7R89_25750 [Dehalococcoidia bacterium]